MWTSLFYLEYAQSCCIQIDQANEAPLLPGCLLCKPREGGSAFSMVTSILLPCMSLSWVTSRVVEQAFKFGPMLRGVT